jgi:glutaredoxin
MISALLSRWFARWGRQPRPALEHLQFLLYTRRGCHLCENAWRRLQEAQRQYGFGLAEVDIDSDPELVARHGNQVPVVTVNGKVRFRGAVNDVLLARLLYAESTRSPPAPR